MTKKVQLTAAQRQHNANQGPGAAKQGNSEFRQRKDNHDDRSGRGPQNDHEEERVKDTTGLRKNKPGPAGKASPKHAGKRYSAVNTVDFNNIMVAGRWLGWLEDLPPTNVCAVFKIIFNADLVRAQHKRYNKQRANFKKVIDLAKKEGRKRPDLQLTRQETVRSGVPEFSIRRAFANLSANGYDLYNIETGHELVRHPLHTTNRTSSGSLKRPK